ncbi:MAG: HEPN domain-containing protein [Halobacteriales archaeon]|jgi:HEPN domain-containing protein
MSSEEQAKAYLEAARLTLSAAEAIYDQACRRNQVLWAQVVKNAYDAIEQAVSAGIAAESATIPRSHPAKVNTVIDLYTPPEAVETLFLYWLQRRSHPQYVDIKGDEINVPQEQFDREDADRILDDAKDVLEFVAISTG